MPRHTVAEHRNSEPNIAAAMLGFAYIALALLCSTQRCLCFATFSAAEPCRCTTELCHATLYHCLVMLLYTLPLPHYSLLRSTLPLRYISVLHDAAPYLSFTKHSHCFSEQLTTWLCLCAAPRCRTVPWHCHASRGSAVPSLRAPGT